MANYECAVRTSYFRVTNEEKYQELCKGLVGECLEFWDEMRLIPGTEEKALYHGFGSYGYIDYCIPFSLENEHIRELLESGEELFTEEGEPLTEENISSCETILNNRGKVLIERWELEEFSFDEFITELQSIIHPDDCFVYIEAGNEKLRYITGIALVATCTTCSSFSLDDFIRGEVKKLKGPDYRVYYTY